LVFVREGVLLCVKQKATWRAIKLTDVSENSASIVATKIHLR